MKRMIVVICCILFFSLSGMASADTVTLPTNTGPITLDTKYFPTALVDSSLSSTSLIFGSGIGVTMGPFTTAAAEPLIIGSDITKGVALGEGPPGGVADYLVPGFGDASIINGAGPDLIVWEAGSPAENFYLQVSTDGGSTFTAGVLFDTFAAVPGDSSSGYATNTGYIDLDLFSLAADAKVDAVKFYGLFTGIGGSGPDFLAIGIINAGTPTGNVPGTQVPEPTTMMLLGLGLIGLVGVRRKTKK